MYDKTLGYVVAMALAFGLPLGTAVSTSLPSVGIGSPVWLAMMICFGLIGAATGYSIAKKKTKTERNNRQYKAS